MDRIRLARWARAWVWALGVAMVLPWFAGCATLSEAGGIRLAGIVVDGERRAEGDEAASLVWVWRGDEPLPVRPGMRLEKGDRIATHERAEAVIRFPGGTTLYLRPASRGRIGSFTEALGEMFAKVWGVFSIETEYVKAGARGTAFAVRAAADGTMAVLVVNGSVEISSPTKAWRPVVLAAGSATVAQREPPRPRPASAQELAETQAWVERLDTIVPPGSTGRPGAGAALGAAAVVAAANILFGSGDERPPDGGPERRPSEPPPGPPPPGPPPPGPPTGLRPGAVEPARAPVLDCRDGVTLAWNRVPGAEAYAVTLQALRPRIGQWQRVPLPVTDATRVRTPPGLNGRLRWFVQARDARGDGPPSATLHFDCSAGLR